MAIAITEQRRAERAIMGGSRDLKATSKLLVAEHGHERAAVADAFAGPGTAFAEEEGASGKDPR